MSSIHVSEGSVIHTVVDSAEPAVLGKRADCLMGEMKVVMPLTVVKMLEIEVLKRNPVV